MNIQPVDGNTLRAAQSRIRELQESIRAQELSMSHQRIAHYHHRLTALKQRMRPNEFTALFPDAPVDGDFVVENNEIAQKLIERQALIDTLPGDFGSTVFSKIQRVEHDILVLKLAKLRVIESYLTNQAQPERAMTAAEFDRIYLEPTFTEETAAIDAARIEANQIDAFFKSGPYPQPGNYDVDMLVGTALEPV